MNILVYILGCTLGFVIGFSWCGIIIMKDRVKNHDSFGIRDDITIPIEEMYKRCGFKEEEKSF